MLVTDFRNYFSVLCWWPIFDVGAKLLMLVTWLVTNIQNLSPTHSVSNIGHQHWCNPDWVIAPNYNFILVNLLHFSGVTSLKTRMLFTWILSNGKDITKELFTTAMLVLQMESWNWNCEDAKIQKHTTEQKLHHCGIRSLLLNLLKRWSNMDILKLKYRKWFYWAIFTPFLSNFSMDQNSIILLNCH